MQVEDHAGYEDTDLWTRWLPEYDTRSYQSQVMLCKTATRYWEKQRWLARLALDRVKTDIAQKRWRDRLIWCRANVARWENTLRDCMDDEGVLKHFRFEK